MAKNLRWLFCLAILCMVVGAIVPVAAADQKPLVAVLPFDDGSIKDHWWGNDWDVGKGISDLITNALFESGKFRVVEREKIAQIIEEQNFGASGRVDQRTAAQIGKLLGAKFFIMGRVTEFTVADKGARIGGVQLKNTTARVSVDGRMVNTTTGEILSTGKGLGEKSQAGLRLDLAALPHVDFTSDRFEETILGKATNLAVDLFVKDIAKGFQAGPTVIAGKVASVSGGKIALSVGKVDGVTVDMIFVISRPGAAIADPDDPSQILGYEEATSICEVKVTAVAGDHLCYATVTKTLTSGMSPKVGDVATQKT